MLTSDFFLFTTTSNKGSQFYDFSSQSYSLLVCCALTWHP